MGPEEDLWSWAWLDDLAARAEGVVGWLLGGAGVALAVVVFIGIWVLAR